jgi:iron complex outermembrane receptor protein
MKYKYNEYAAALLAAILTCNAGHATANADDAMPLPKLATTTVSGDLWQTPLELAATSISVIDAESSASLGISHFENLIESLPNVTTTGGTSRTRFIQIRGIGENSQFEGETPDSAVRFVIDDIDFTGLGSAASLFDVRQVEVLRGPQAGAFGANAAGGLIQLVSNAPTPLHQGFVSGSIGNDNLIEGGIAVGGPVIENEPETLMYRIALHRRAQDGFRDNRFLNKSNTNKRDESLARLRLTWNPSSQVNWDSTLLYSRLNNGYDEWSLDNTGFNTFSDQPGRDKQSAWAGSLRGTWDNPNTRLTSITSAKKVDSIYSFDADWTDTTDPRTYNGFLATDRDRRTGSQEFRLDSLDNVEALGIIDRWTLGFYAEALREKTNVDYSENGPGGPYDFDAKSSYQTHTISFYAQAAKTLSDNTRIILGSRIEHYRLSVRAEGNDTFGATSQNQQRIHNTLPGAKLTLEQDLNYSHRIFLSFASGYKAGGANLEINQFIASQPLTYKTERLWNYEFGWRGKWLNQRLDTQLTVFYLDRRNTQLRDSIGSGGFFTYTTTNKGNAHHYGSELETRWEINDYWVARGHFAILQAEFKDSGQAGGGRRRLSNAPSYSYGAGLDFNTPNGFFSSLEFTGRDSYFEANNHDERRTAMTIVNAAIGYNKDNWTFSLWSRNLFNERYEKRVFFFANEAPAFAIDRRYESPADPRTIGITAHLTF